MDIVLFLLLNFFFIDILCKHSKVVACLAYVESAVVVFVLLVTSNHHDLQVIMRYLLTDLIYEGLREAFVLTTTVLNISVSSIMLLQLGIILMSVYVVCVFATKVVVTVFKIAKKYRATKNDLPKPVAVFSTIKTFVEKIFIRNCRFNN